jgi:NAD-dependent dihydropyrimidine dehydrogenase PreA subunit
MTPDDVYTQLAAKLKYPPSEHLLKILGKTMTPEEGELLLQLPLSAQEIASNLGRDDASVSEKLDELVRRGLAIPVKGKLFFSRNVVQLHDSTLSVYDERVDDELLRLWKEFYDAELRDGLGQLYELVPSPIMKVVPAKKALEQSISVSQGEVLPEEDATGIVRGAQSIALVPCPCRRVVRGCDSPLEVCLQFDGAAETALRKTGRRLTPQEALDVVDLAEEKGLVHVVPVKSNQIMCNCCRDCCMIFDPCLARGNIGAGLVRSRYVCGVDGEACVGCGVCVDRCPVGAVRMIEDPSGDQNAVVVEEKCYGCGVCVLDCATDAMSLKVARAQLEVGPS